MPNNDYSPTKIKEWLEKQGYSLEMRVARVFQEAGFNVSQFEHYIDPESKDVREVDNVASVSGQINGLSLVLELLIECKYLKKPWAVFVSPQSFHVFDYFSHILENKTNVYEWQTYKTFQGRLLAKILSVAGRNEILKLSAFTLPQNIGYGVTETLRDDPKAKDNAFIASMQISKCLLANYLENQQNYVSSTENLDLETRSITKPFSLYCSIAMPLIVVKGELYECSLDKDAKISVTKTDNVLLSVTNKEGSGKSNQINRNMIRLLTEDKLEDYTKEAYKAFSFLLSQEEAIKEVYDFEKNQSSIFKQGEIPF